MASESKRTVLVALAANAVIAVAKLVGGLVSGSSAMLAEAAHSVADTLNQVFLLRSLSVSQRSADMAHPFGYGKARFFWAFIAAVGIFVAGAVFSLYEGVHALLTTGADEEIGLLVPYSVLGVSLAAEGTSWIRAIRQLQAEAAQVEQGFFEHLRASKDPTVKTVLLEDTAAVIGILLAAAGIGAHYVTGNAAWDGAAAVAVGILLVVVAFLLGRETGGLLIGEAAGPELVVGVHDEITACDEVEQVVELLTMQLAPEAVLVAVRLDLRDDLTAAEVEAFSSRMEHQLAQHWPSITQVFLDATRADGDSAARTRRYVQRLRTDAPQRGSRAATRADPGA